MILRFCLILSANVLAPLLSFAGGIDSNKSWGTASDDIIPFGFGILSNAWLVNLPQLVLSLCYLALNTICTSIASAQEWNNLGKTRKGLRVTRPEASQRSTYFLQLPYKWATPLLLTSGILHWLLSQSFFLVRIDVLDRKGAIVEESSQSACGYSRLSLLIFFVVAFLLVCAIGLIATRSLEQKVPFAASCSLVISAACHPPKQEIDTHLKEVKWGVVEEQTEQGYAHCSITALPTIKQKLVEGRVYR
ncbi:hypothetical protein BU23DRAFT_462453 [Bimuria novae-zelandiae CBS 107.79]|uniref:CSC1/OSCA1-like N-terminal transmembrane domain-containing protein n=1 Tax=Bimuria novae-zelandiae CBS 107.79 TaxID=1447943 RepID=A0A6A5VAD4_9PLEO|nr:hypothetical protein BU23DRAFT_462453 [Bimuria novae-zelandiae CBS 107.79]